MKKIKNYIILLLFYLSSSHSQIIGSTVWNLDTFGLGNESSPLDRMGETLSRGDYNNDGWQDLAIGIPNYDFVFFGTTPNVGTVLILYGSENGISSNNSQLLFQSFLENEGVEANDLFGTSLASGDFNCDGITDLAVGTPEESREIFPNSPGLDFRSSVGAINIFYGSDTGFDNLGAGSTFLFESTDQNNIEFSGIGDRFGWSMVAGNFNGDIDSGNICVDLAVSSPFEDLGNGTDQGLVYVFYGSTTGISGDNRDALAQNTFNADGDPENGDQFGRSLASGRFRGPFIGVGGVVFYSDLVVGIPGEDVGGVTNAGAVQVFNGGATGVRAHLLSANDDFIWSQSGAIVGSVEANDRFGTTLTTGNFNGDLYTDLVVGIPREDLNADGISNAGAINVIYGAPGGLSTVGNQLFTQNTIGIEVSAENSDQFGDSLTSGDLNYDLYSDLVVGVPRENSLRGAFHVIYGGSNGLTTTNNIYRTNQPLDEMGFAMVIGDFGNGPELAVGLPGDDSFDGDNDSGSVQVFEFLDTTQPLIFKDSFE